MTLETGAFIMNQIIYSPVGLFQPQVQMTFRYYDPNTGENVWKSKNVDSFQVLANDKHSCKSSAFTVNFKNESNGSQSYNVSATLDNDVQLMYSMTRPSEAKGWKLGQGPKGGFSYFGENEKSPEGYVVHRFWPYTKTSGMVVINGRAIEAKGQGMFVQAIQGMRPNLVATRWNFGNFQSKENNGTSAIVMEFTTTSGYGKVGASPQERVPQTVTIGSVVCGGQLVSVVGATRASNAAEVPATHVQHALCAKDELTGYDVPQLMKFVLQGPAVVGVDKPSADTIVEASMEVSLGSPAATNGLIEKVDVLAEIPYMVRKLVNYVAGAKPYIYQTLNPTHLRLELPASVAKAVGTDSSIEVPGVLFEEHTFISE